MKGTTLNDIATASGLVVPGRFGDCLVRRLLTDSRKLREPEGTLFFALRTDHGDGHRYVGPLYLDGVRMFVVEEIPPEAGAMPDAVWLKVPDTLKALQVAGALHRSHARSRLAVTGSRGKTSLKEWLYQLLRDRMDVWRSPRSYNSQLGVPLSLWDIPEGVGLAIIEAGISKEGEMESLADCIKPEAAIVTNIGEEHAEGFRDKETKAREKILLAAAPGVRMLVMPEDPTLRKAARSVGISCPIVSWEIVGQEEKNPSATLHLRVDCEGGNRRISYDWDGIGGLPSALRAESGMFSLPGNRREEVANAASALAFMLADGIGSAPLRDHGAELRHVETRLDVSEGVNGCKVVRDSYTSDLGSLPEAMDFMRRRRTEGEGLTVILSDLLHESPGNRQTYLSAAEIIRGSDVDRFIGVGPELSANSGLFPEGSLFFRDTDELLRALSPSDFSSEEILLKDAPGFDFGRIKEMLELRTHETLLEVNLSALRSNFNYFRSLVKPSTGVIAMVKASGYGAGSLEIARTLQDAGAAYLAVAVLDEGIELRRQGIEMPIMVMNPKVVNYRQMFANFLEPEIYSLEMLEDVVREAGKCRRRGYPIHLKLDTGMHRMGLIEEELPRAIEIIESQDSVSLSSVFSHLATADCLDMDDYTCRQLHLFERLTGEMRRRLKSPFKRHILNSAGIIRFPEYDYDFVRLGIGLYGVNTLPADIEKPLERVSTLRTVIISLRQWEAGESIGYGRKSVLSRKSTIATLPIGYADGMDRHLGNGKVSVLVNGQWAPTVGNICMDACMVDVTGIDCKVGDGVEIFGRQAPIDRLSEALDTIPYEILTSVSPRVKRIYYNE